MTARRRRLTLPAAALGVPLVAVGATAAPAAAHVTVQPEQVKGGGFAVVAFRVPNERDAASTTRVQVLLPEDQPVGSVSTTPVPGWRVVTATRALEEPIEMFGEEVTEVVSEVTWSATGKGVGPGEFEDFELSLGPLPESGDMVFSAIQKYSSGEKVAWNEVAVDGTTEPEHPAPVLTVAPAADTTGTGQAAEASSEVDGASDTSSSAEGGTAAWSLGVSVVALGLAAVALATALRRRSTWR